jgi:toxin-antitoxin system PIN domain toxin
MSILNFLDTNVWLALVWERHSGSETARAWFSRCEDERFLFCRFTQLALLRLLTNKAVMGKEVKSMAGAWEVYDECCTEESIAFLPEPAGLEPRLRDLAKGRHSSPNVWADAYLAAFAAAAGLKVVTFDKALGAKCGECLVLQ